MRSIFLYPVLLVSILFQMQAHARVMQKADKFYTEIGYETVNGKIFIYGELGGRKRKFLFDTGAPSQISKELFKELNVSINSKVAVVDAFQNRDSVAITTLPKIRLNDAEIDSVQAFVMYPDFYRCWKIDGVIGANLLKGCLVQINADKHMIILTNDESRLNLRKDNGIAMAVKGMQLRSELSFYLGRRISAKFYFDTGDPGFLLMPDAYREQLIKYQVFEVMSTGYGINSIGTFGNEKSDSTYRLKFNSVKIAGAEFKNVIVETTKSGTPRLGSQILEYGVVTLDYIHNKFYFDPIVKVNDLYEKKWPVNISVNNNQWIICGVWKEANNNIGLYQEILSVNGNPLPSTSLCEYVNTGSFLKGKDKAILTLKAQNGNVKTVEVIKQ